MELTLELLLAFKFDSEREYRTYVDEYVQIVLASNKGNAKIRQMVILTETMLTMNPREGRRSAQVNAVQDYLEASLRKQLPKYIHPGDLDRIEGAKCDDIVKKELLEMIRNSGWNNNPGGKLNDFLGGIGAGFNDLFRRGKK